MKKILLSLMTVGLVLVSGIYATRAYFSDTEESVDNVITAGTIDIAVDGQNPWDEEYSASLEDMKPSYVKFIEFDVENVGSNPLRLWKHIKDVESSEGELNEPECTSPEYQGVWTDNGNGTGSCSVTDVKNDIDTVIEYDMYIGGEVVIDEYDYFGNPIAGHVEGGNVVIHEDDGITLADVTSHYIYIGEFEPGETKHIIQSYHMATDTGNWAQGDELTFDIELLALQQNAPGPETTTLMLENKTPSGSWPTLPGDGTYGMLTYQTVNSTFDYDFVGRGLQPGVEYSLIYYADPWPGNNPGKLIANHTADGSGNIDVVGASTDLAMDLADPADDNYPGAKIWLVPSNEYDDTTNSLSWWNPGTYLFEYNLVQYDDSDI